MSRELHTASVPNALQAIGFALLIAGLFLRMQHWPFAIVVLIAGLAVAGCWLVVTMTSDKG